MKRLNPFNAVEKLLLNTSMGLNFILFLFFFTSIVGALGQCLYSIYHLAIEPGNARLLIVAIFFIYLPTFIYWKDIKRIYKKHTN